MSILESVRTSAAEIRSHKLRSILTLIGIVLGTTALVVNISVIGGAAKAVQKGLTDLGYDGVLVVTAQQPTDRLELKKRGYSRGLRTADLSTIDEGRELVQGAAPVVSLTDVARVNGRELRLTVEGITPRYAELRGRETEKGRWVIDADLENVAPVCVIGSTALIRR